MHASKSWKRRCASVAFAIVLLATGGLLLRSRSTEGLRDNADLNLAQSSATPTDTTPLHVAPLVVPTTSGVSASRTGSMRVTRTRAGTGDVRIQAATVLATVNGTPLTLKDLLPLPEDQQNSARVLSAERYTFLLERAVDREIILQQARTQGLELSDGQRAQLEKLRLRAEVTHSGVFDTLQHDPANAEFEVRDAAALLLQATLAAAAGVPPREVTAAQVEAYYREHPSEFATLPSDPAKRQTVWETISRDIRVKLARENLGRHEEAFAAFVERSRAAAHIVRNDPSL